MKLKTVLIASIFLGIASFSFAQTNNKMQVSKFVYATSLGFSSGIGTLNFDSHHLDNDRNSFKIQQLLAYQFNNYVTVGLGGGIDIWQKTAFIPLYASVQVNFIDRRLTPYIFLNTGYAFKWYGSQSPDASNRVIHGSTAGLHGEGGLGIKIRMNEKVAFLIAANYTAQQTSIKYSTPDTDASLTKLYTNSQQDLFYHFIGLKLGILY